MRNFSRYAVVTVVAGLVLAGCGSENGAGGTPSDSPSTSGPSAPTLPTATPSAETFPLVISRTGGFAGFDDRVQVGPDGVATVTSRDKAPIRCKLDESVLAPLTQAALQVDWSSVVASKPATKHPDDMILAVSSNGKTTRLEDPKVKPMVAPVNKLLTEATNPPGKLCPAV